jgi:glycosyltransferase involved in cell wall biosynthesis
VAGDVRLLGWVNPAELEGLYAAAACVVVPSLHEGFGLPVLEAMARGVPVACARATALPELAEGAAELFDPRDVDEIAGAMLRALERGPELARLGRERVAGLSWERTARETAAVYREALE